MTKRAELLALAERVEQMSGEHRGLNWAIYKLINGPDRDMEKLISRGGCSYTSSLDAAMTLVPGGWSVGLGDLRGYCPIVWRAHLRDHNEPDSMRRQYREGHAATPALAPTAACLRALAEKEA